MKNVENNAKKISRMENTANQLRSEKSTTESELDNTYSSQISRFVEGLTLHGLNHVCASTANRIRRCLWLLLLLSMAAGYITIAVYSCQKYYRYETTTKINRQTVDHLEFPGISICHPNLIPRSLIDQDPDLHRWMLHLQGGDSIASLNLTAAETQDARAVLDRYNLETTLSGNETRLIRRCRINDAHDCHELFYAEMSESSLCWKLFHGEMNGQYDVLTTTQPGQRHGLREYTSCKPTGCFHYQVHDTCCQKCFLFLHIL